MFKGPFVPRRLTYLDDDDDASFDASRRDGRTDDATRRRRDRRRRRDDGIADLGSIGSLAVSDGRTDERTNDASELEEYFVSSLHRVREIALDSSSSSAALDAIGRSDAGAGSR